MDYLFLVENPKVYWNKFSGNNSKARNKICNANYRPTYLAKKTPNVTLTNKNPYDEQEAFYMIKLNTYLFTAAVAMSYLTFFAVKVSLVVKRTWFALHSS